MDSELRANQDDLVALLRAGRLSHERVAMAAYLGDERALLTGVEPWEPPEPLPEWCWRARFVLLFGDLTSQECAWLSALVSARAIDGLWPDDSIPAIAVRATRAWCLGEGTEADASEAAKSAWQVAFLASREAESSKRSRAALAAMETAHAATPERERAGGAAGSGALEAARAGDDYAAEQSWQARAIADVLLDPSWPPWVE